MTVRSEDCGSAAGTDALAISAVASDTEVAFAADESAMPTFAVSALPTAGKPAAVATDASTSAAGPDIMTTRVAKGALKPGIGSKALKIEAAN